MDNLEGEERRGVQQESTDVAVDVDLQDTYTSQDMEAAYQA